MHDWNGNGKYDSGDSFMDFHMSKGGGSGGSSGWWIWLLIALVSAICPPIGFLFLIGILIWGDWDFFYYC